MAVNTIASLLSQVIQNGECLEFTGAKGDGGYGRASLNNKVIYMHRLSYAARFGEIPDGLHVLHKCDNPPCINPEHLFLGTNLDNIADRVKKGRRCGPIKKPICKNGHAMSGDNLGIVSSTGREYCKACHTITRQKYESKLKNNEK